MLFLPISSYLSKLQKLLIAPPFGGDTRGGAGGDFGGERGAFNLDKERAGAGRLQGGEGGGDPRGGGASLNLNPPPLKPASES